MANVSDEVKAFFTSDTNGLREGVKAAGSLMDESARKEKYVADYIRNERRKSEREAALAPIKAKEAADKSAKAQMESAKKASDYIAAQGYKMRKDRVVSERKSKDADREKLVQEAYDAKAKRQEEAGRVERQKKASSYEGIKKELAGNFGKNAREKIGGLLQSKLGLSEDAAQGLLTRAAKILPIAGGVALAVTAAAKAYAMGAAFAGEQAAKMHDLSEEMTAASRVNVFSSSTDGVDSLSEKIQGNLEVIKKSRQALQDNDPYQLGMGVLPAIGNSILRKAQKPFDFFNDSPFEQQQREADNQGLQQRGKAQEIAKETKQRTEGLKTELDLTRQRLTMDAQGVAISDLELQKKTALAQLARNHDTRPEDIAAVRARYDVQIGAQRELQKIERDRFRMEREIIELQRGVLTPQQQSYEAARARAAEAIKELTTNQNLTEEKRRQLTLEKETAAAEVNSAQRNEALKSPRQQNMDRIRRGRERVRQQKAQDRVDATDGLYNTVKDKDGFIIGGRDMVTDELRGITDGSKLDFKQRLQKGKGGLYGGRDGLGNTGLGAYNDGKLDPSDFKPKDSQSNGPGQMLQKSIDLQLKEQQTTNTKLDTLITNIGKPKYR